MIVYINEVDKDYGTVSDTLKKEFETLQDANEWCVAESWSGYHYCVDVDLTVAVNKQLKEKTIG